MSDPWLVIRLMLDPDSSSRNAARERIVKFYWRVRRLIVQNDIEQGTVDLQSAAVTDETQLSAQG